MKYLFTTLSLVFTLVMSQTSFGQVKPKGPTTNLMLPPPVDPGDGDGGGYTPPPVYGHYVLNGNAGSTFAGFQITLFEGNNATQDIIANGRISNVNPNATMSGRFRVDAFTIFTNVFLFNGEMENADNLIEVRDKDIATVFALEALALVDHFHFLNSHPVPDKPVPTDSKKTIKVKLATYNLYTDNKWSKSYYKSGDLHYIDRELFAAS